MIVKEKSILLVEDEAIIALDEKQLLEKRGFSVLCVSNGEDAIASVAENPSISLILMDIDLGDGIDGTEVARRILDYHKLPIVFLTSHNEKDYVERVKEITRYGYVLKNSGEFILIEAINMAYELFDAHEKLSKSESRYIKAQKLGKVGNWEYNPSTKDFWGSLQAKAIYGFDPDSDFFSAETVEGCIPERERVHQALIDLLESDKEYNLEFNIFTFDTNEKKVIQSLAEVERDSEGNPVLVTGVIQDITETVQEKEKIRQILKTAVDGYCLIDSDFNLLEMNDAMSHMSGYTMDELKYLSVRDIDAVMTEDEVAGIFEKVRKGRSIMFETKHQRKNGTIYDAEVSLSLIEVNGGKFYPAFVRDITERNHAEMMLRISREKYKALYENAPLAYQSLTEEGNFIDVNPTWLTILGYKRDEVIGSYFGDFLHPDWKTVFDKNFPAFKKRGYVHDVQFKIRHKKGNYIDVSFEGCIGYNRDGSFRQTYCVFKDITGQKAAEEELQNSLKKNEQLLLELQHRIKNSFSLIQGMIELMKGRYVSDESSLVLHEVESKINAVSDLYTMLYEADSISDIRLDSYLEKLVSTYHTSERGISLHLDLDRVQLPVKLAVPLGLIISELVTNTLKYAFPDNDGGAVSLKLVKEGDVVQLAYKDDGVGLPVDFSLDKTDSLGLTLVKALSEQIGAELSIEGVDGVQCSLVFAPY